MKEIDMMSRYSIFCGVMHKFILLFLVCMLNAACQDEPLMESSIEDVDGMATINLEIPTTGKDVPDEQKIEKVRFMAFASRTSGSSDEKADCQYNDLVTNGHKIILPVGKTDFYISANAEFAGLDNISNPAELKNRKVPFEKLTQPLFPMIGVYKNIDIKNGEAKDAEGNAVNIGAGLVRVASKLTVNIEYTSKEKEYDLTVDSAKVFNRPAEVTLLPTIYAVDRGYVSATADMKNAEKEKDLLNTNSMTTTVYKPMTFYLSEYLLSKETMKSSTYVQIYAHTVKPNSKEVIKKEYKVYIGDWFGTTDYSTFPQDDPTKLGAMGLGITRGKHYILNGKLEGSGELLGNTTTVSVEDWKAVTINGDIIHPFLNLSDTELLINPLDAQGTALTYTTNRPFEEIKVELGDNPNGRFIFEGIGKDGEIRFKHKIDGIQRLDTLIDGVRKPFTCPVKITLNTPNGVLEKQVTLISFNPISRFYLRTDADYASLKPQTTLTDDMLKAPWRIARGYRSVYSGFGDSDKKDFDPNVKTMGDAASDTISGCAQYWENSTTDFQKGQGHWRLPKGTSQDGNDSELKRMQTLLSNFPQDALMEGLYSGVSFWGSNDEFTNAYILSEIGDVRTSQKSSNHYVRCIRDTGAQKLKDASYLNVSHSYYEVPLFAYRYDLIPITFESDVPVDIEIYNELGENISNIENREIPFIGRVDDVPGAYMPYTVFPVWMYIPFGKYYYYGKENTYFSYLWDNCGDRTHGNFYLDPAMLKVMGENPTKNGSGEILGTPPRLFVNKLYRLIFKAGSIKKVVSVKVVNNLADEKLSRESSALNHAMTYFEAHGVRRKYVGYNIKTNTAMLDETDLNFVPWVSLVPDTLTGCAAYYEGSPSDPETGIGNWRLDYYSPSGLYSYVLTYCFNQYNDKTLVESEATWKNLLGFSLLDVDYWTNYTSPDNNSLVQITKPYNSDVNASWSDKTDKKYVRCVRMLNKDRLQLSSLNVTFKIGGKQSAEILYYTDANDIEMQRLFFSKSKDREPFEVSNDGTGRIRITRKDNSIAGDKMNLLIQTKSDNPKKKQYRIISVQVIN